MDRIRLLMIMLIMIVVGTLVSAAQTINFKVDMTVIWAVDLPKSVYVVFDGGGTTITTSNMKQTDSGRERDIYLNYNDTYRKTGVEQDIAHCMELTDPDYDGIYTGTMEYTGSTSGTYSTRLFLSKEDKKNTMGNPIYEVWCSTYSIDYMGWADRKIAISTSGTQTLKWAWENKDISGWRSLSGNPNTGTSGSNTNTTGSITLHNGFSKKLVLNASFYNDAAVTRDVSKSVVFISGDTSIADIEKLTDSTGNVIYTKIVAKKAGTTTLTLRVGCRNYKEFSLTVTVTDSTINAGEQTIIFKPSGGIATTDRLGIDNNLTVTGNPRIVGLSSDTTSSIIKSSYDYTSFYYFAVSGVSYGSGYTWWTPSIAANGVITSVTSYTSSDLSFTKTDTITSGSSITAVKMPTHVATVTMTTGANPEFSWTESVSENANYTSRYTIARICKIGTSGTSIKFNPYAGNAAAAGNPIVDASGASTAVSNFDASPATAAYIDYVFSSASTKLSKDGRAVKKNENMATGVQTLTLMQFPIGEYKLQIYTIKGNSVNGYSVLTFEAEEAFEITKEDYVSSLKSTDDTYIINDINPSGFDNININFTTRTAKTISAAEMLSRVVYNGTTIGSNRGIKEYKKNSVTSIFAATGNNNTDLLSDGSLMQITKVSDNDTNRMPMDVILCLDRTTSMNSKMTAIKTAWTNFETAMSEKGYDVKYQLVSFGGSALGWNYETTSWQSSLQGLYGSKFTGTSGEGGWTYDDAYSAIEYSIDIMEGTVAGTAGGRYYGYNTSTGQWGPVTTVTNTPSEKVVIFMTDTYTVYPGSYGNANAYEVRIRTSGVQLIGLCPVERSVAAGTGKNIFVYDEYGVTAETANESSDGTNGNSGTDYYDVKILLGDQFKLYQINDNSATIEGQLIAGMQTINSTAVWNLTYRTPYPECDGTERKVDFNVLNKDGNGIKYDGADSDRVYAAPELKVYSEITNPTSDGVFEEAESGYYRVRGRAWGELKFADALIDAGLTTDQRYPDIKNSMLEIATVGAGVPVNLIKPGSATAIYSADFAHADRVTFGDGAVGFEYIFDVPSENIINTGAEEFDVKVTAYSIPKNGWSTSGIGTAIRVKADADPPIITDIKMVNITVRDAMLAMRGSESGTGNVFSTDLEVLNTLWYKPYADTSLKSNSTSIVQPKFENRESKSTYDGRFVKDGDVIKVTAVMYDQNFDDSAVTMITNNRIAATFTNLGVSGEVYPTGINIENVTVGGVAAKKLTVTWEISVSNATKVTNITSIMKIKAIDKYGNSSIDATKATNAIGDIEIAKIDNNHPVYAEWESGKAVTNSAKADLTSFASKTAGSVITNQPYQLNCYAGAGTVDENGIRAFKVYYTYDSTQSDWGSAGESTTGNHDADMHTIGTETIGYFYIKAGNAINLSWSGTDETQLPASGYGVKTPNTSTSGDDGKYIFKVTAVDKAGNETYYSSTIKDFNISRIEDNAGVTPKIVYVDTRAPEIDRGQIYVEKYTIPGEINYWNIVKNGDKAYIHTVIKDFSAVTDDTTDAFNLDNRYHKTGTYPKYSGLIGNGVGSENPVFAGVSVTTVNNRKNLVLKIGEVADGTNPYMIILGKSNLDYLTPIIIGAKDLAGNEFIDTGIDCRVDNIKPGAPDIKSYAMESKFITGLESFYPDTASCVTAIDRDATKTHFSKHRDYYWIKNSSAIDSDVERVYFSANGGTPTYISKTTYLNNLYNGFYKITDVIENKVNTLSMSFEDKAGNKSDSDSDEIVIDRLVPNGNAKTIFLGGVAVPQGGNNYKFEIIIKDIPDYAGLQQFEANISGETATVKKIPTYDPLINAPLTTASNRSLAESIILNVPKVKIGTYVDIKVKLYDNLGNTSIVTYRVFVPTTKNEDGANKTNRVEVKSQQKGSDKEIRTKVDVMVEDRVDLQKTEETGKNAQ